MIFYNQQNCPICDGKIKYYDRVSRIVRTKYGKITWIRIRRYRCTKCGRFHRKLPSFLFPYKQYESDIIRGVLAGWITCETLGYEDYPCEETMKRWGSQKTRLL